MGFSYPFFQEKNLPVDSDSDLDEDMSEYVVEYDDDEGTDHDLYF